jgi:hypothetical protein
MDHGANQTIGVGVHKTEQLSATISLFLYSNAPSTHSLEVVHYEKINPTNKLLTMDSDHAQHTICIQQGLLKMQQ